MKKVKNIPTYYTFPGTKIFRDTTALPFKKGGPVNTSGPVAEPTPPIPITIENLNNIYPAFRNLENVVLTPDPTYTRDKTGLGDIEYISPDRGAEPIRYPTGYELPVPQPGAHNIVYNPDSTTIENVKLDLFSHGLRTSDPTYQKYLAEFTKAYKKSHGKTMDHWYQQDSEAGYAEDGREQWDDNYIDGVLRGIFHGGTMSEKLNDRYNPTEEADTILDHPELIEKIGQIRTYLETPQLDYLQKSLQLPATFADGGPLHDRDINGKLLNSTYAPQLGDMFREGGPFKDDIGAFDYAKSIYASQLGDYYRTGGQFPRPYSLPEDSFKQGGRGLHNSVYASSPAQYPAVYNFGGTLKNNLATRQQMYMPLDHITRNGGSILSMSNTPELSGEGKDLTVPDNAYYYANGGSMNTPWLHNLYADGGGLFDRFKRKNKEEANKTEQPAFGQPLPTDPQGAPYAFTGESPACPAGQVWDENLQSCVIPGVQELPTMYASAKPETNEKRIKFLDKANALWDTVEGRKVWMQNGPKNYSLNELSKFVHNAKDYKKQAEVYEKYRRMAQDDEISGDEFARLYNENNWAKFDQATTKENFKGEYKQAVEKGNKEKEEYAKRMASDAGNALLEYSGANSIGRAIEHPIETLSDAGQTIMDIGMAAPELPYRLYDYASNLFTPWNRTTGQSNQYTDNINPTTGQPYWSGAQGAMDLINTLPLLKLGTTAATAGVKGTANAVNKIPSSKVLLQSAEQKLGSPATYNLFSGNKPALGLSSQGLIDDALRTTSNPTPVSLNIPENSAIGSPQLKTVLSANGQSAQARYISPDSPDFAAATAAIEAQKAAGNPTILKNYTNHEGLGYSSPEALMTAQAEEFKRATDFAHQWGLKDPTEFAKLSAEAPALRTASNQAYTNLSQAWFDAYDKFNTLRDNWLWANGHNPYDLEHIMTIADGEELAKARAILDEAEAAAEKNPELIQLKLEFDKAEEARKIAIAKQEKLGNALEQQMDPTVKAKIEKIFAASGQPMPPSNLAMQDIQGMVSAPKLLYSDPAHPSYTSLNPVERAQIESIKDRAGGVKLDNSTITFGSKISQPSIFSIETPNTSVQPEASINPLTWINPLKNPVKVPGSQNYVQVINEQLLHPEAVGSVNAHEIGHDIGRFYSWINQLQVNDPAFKYYTGTDKNPIAAVFKKFMVSPTAPVNNTFTTETWRSGVGELHANLMIVRNKAAQKLVKEGIPLKEAINTIKQLEAAGDDKLFNEYLNSTEIKQHFNETATPEIRKQLLQYLPAVLGVIGTGAAIDANASSESKPTKGLKNGGYVPIYNFPNNKIKKFPTFTNR